MPNELAIVFIERLKLMLHDPNTLARMVVNINGIASINELANITDQSLQQCLRFAIDTLLGVRDALNTLLLPNQILWCVTYHRRETPMSWFVQRKQYSELVNGALMNDGLFTLLIAPHGKAGTKTIAYRVDAEVPEFAFEVLLPPQDLQPEPDAAPPPQHLKPVAAKPDAAPRDALTTMYKHVSEMHKASHGIAGWQEPEEIEPKAADRVDQHNHRLRCN